MRLDAAIEHARENRAKAGDTEDVIARIKSTVAGISKKPQERARFVNVVRMATGKDVTKIDAATIIACHHADIIDCAWIFRVTAPRRARGGDKVKNVTTGEVSDRKTGDADAARNADVDDAIKLSAVRSVVRNEIAYALEPSQLPQVYHLIDASGEKRTLDVDIAHAQFPMLLKLMTMVDPTSGERPNVMLVGPTATGKTKACADAAKALGVPFYAYGRASEPTDFIGYAQLDGTWRETAMIKAFRDGGVLLIDEIDANDDVVLTAINGALANGYLYCGDQRIDKHADCYVVAGANTWGTGATAQFNSRNKLDFSTISRFVRLAWGNDNAMQHKILEAAYDGKDRDNALAWFAECVKVRALAAAAGLPDLGDFRTVQRGAAMLAAGIEVEQVRELEYLAGLEADERAMLASAAGGAK